MAFEFSHNMIWGSITFVAGCLLIAIAVLLAENWLGHKAPHKGKICICALFLWVSYMLLVGWKPANEETHPEGEITLPGTIEIGPEPKNERKRTEELRDEGDKLQNEGFDELQKFRQKMLKGDSK